MSGITYQLAFTSAAIEDPLSAGGAFSNNTQGVGGNVAPTNFANLRVALAADGLTRIAMGAPTPAQADELAFAFKPGVGRNMRVTAVVYRAAGYASPNWHMLELLLGCKTWAGGVRWLACRAFAAGNVSMASIGPGVSTTLLAPYSITAPLADGDVLTAEVIGDTLSSYLNGVFLDRYTGDLVAGLGDGAGIGVFYRAGADVTALGFRSLKVEPI